MTTFWQREKHGILVALIIGMVIAVLLAVLRNRDSGMCGDHFKEG